MPEIDDTADIFNVISEEVDHKLPETQETDSEESRETEPQEEVAAPVAEGTEAPAEPSKTEIETKSEESSEEVDLSQPEAIIEDWKKTVPPAPALTAVKEPEVNEQGEITNMTAQEYQRYLVDTAKNEVRQEAYTQYVENAALDYVEKFLPEIKTNPAVRQLVENQRIADAIAGRDGSVVNAALTIKTLLDGAKVQGAQNAKASITIQKEAALETGSAVQKDEPSKGQQIADRINKGDEDAFIDLLDLWMDEGVIA